MADVTFSIPKPDDAGFVRFATEIDSAMSAFSNWTKRIENGQRISSDDWDRIINAMLLYVARDERDAARESILNFSLPQLTDAMLQLGAMFHAWRSSERIPIPSDLTELT